MKFSLNNNCYHCCKVDTTKIYIEYNGLGIEDEADWQACIDLFVEGVNIINEHLVRLVEDYFIENS